ncbi:MAG TPA: hypothetical protein EYG00_11270 [Alcanivorax sp.]|nr:hypothetical protein [Alcanivorax sp.]
MTLGYFLLGSVGMAMVTLWVSQIIMPIETRYVRAFLNSTSYTEDDYLLLLNTLEDTEHDYNIDMDLLYDAIGMDKET